MIAEVIGSQVDLLPKKAVAHIILAQNLGKFQEQRAEPRRVVNLVHRIFCQNRNARQQFRNILGGKELAPLLPALLAYMLIRYS